MFLSVHPSVYQSIQVHISVTASRNFFNLGKMMAYKLGLMPIWFHFFWWPFTILRNKSNIAVVDMVLSKYLLNLEIVAKKVIFSNNHKYIDIIKTYLYGIILCIYTICIITFCPTQPLLVHFMHDLISDYRTTNP